MPKLANVLPDKIPQQDAKWLPGDSLGVKIEKVFVRWLQRVILWGWEFVSEIAVQIFDASMKILQPGMTRMFKPLMDEVKKAPGLPAWMRSVIDAVEAEQGESKVLGQIALFASLIFGTVAGGLAPLGRVFSYGIDKNLRSMRPTMAEATEMWRRGFLDDNAYNAIKEDTGTPNEIATALNGVMSSDVNPNDLVFGLWRGFYDVTEFKQRLTRVGVAPAYLDLWFEKTKLIPPITDLVHMLVREAFRDDVAQRFGYDDDYPEQINTFFARIGYDPDWAKRYWRAHWQLPSPTQAYEMLHRGLIDQGVLRELLKTADYPRFWREKLEAISYHTYTRVDVRRLIQAGMMSTDEGYKAYLEMGYDPEKARKLTDFAVQGISQEERDLTRTDILNLYEEGLIDRGAALSVLVKEGYDSQEAESILKLSDVSIAKAARTDAINYVKERYQARTLDRTMAGVELSKAGLKQVAIDRYLLAWDRVIAADIAVPSVADVKRWFLAGYIDETKLREYLKLHKHTQDNIEIYVKELKDAKAKIETPPEE